MHPDNPIPQQFATIEVHSSMVATGEYICCAVSGPPGIGKTRIVTRCMDQAKVPYTRLSGKASMVGILAKAYEYRRGGVIVLDDLDDVITGGGASSANVMKQLLDNGSPIREITSTTKEAMRGNALFPSEFATKARIVWITNADLSDPTLGDYAPKARPHIKALLSRNMYPLPVSADPRWVLDYVNDLVVNQRLLGTMTDPLPYGQQVELRDWFVEHAERLPELSVRMLISTLAPMVRTHPTAWRQHVSHLVAAKPIRKIGEIKLEPMAKTPPPKPKPIVAKDFAMKMLTTRNSLADVQAVLADTFKMMQ